MSFESWMEKIDAMFSDIFGGLTSEDFPDACWADMFEDGMSPKQAFKQYCEDEDLNF